MLVSVASEILKMIFKDISNCAVFKLYLDSEVCAIQM